MIPKKIHYVWPGRDEKKGLSQICIETWQDILPADWEIIEWNFDTFDFEWHKANNKFFREICERELYAFIADYVRAVVLYEHGGIYLDTDVSLLKPFSDEILNNKMFLAIQNSKLVEPAIWGAEAHHPFTKEILDFYDDEIWHCNEFVMPDIFAKLLKRKYNIVGFEKEKTCQKIFSTQDGQITFYPEKYFIPYRYGYQYLPTCIEDDTYTIHWFRGSWQNNKKVKFLKSKNKDFYAFIKRLLRNIFSFRINIKKHLFDLKILGIKIVILE